MKKSTVIALGVGAVAVLYFATSGSAAVPGLLPVSSGNAAGNVPVYNAANVIIGYRNSGSPPTAGLTTILSSTGQVVGFRQAGAVAASSTDSLLQSLIKALTGGKSKGTSPNAGGAPAPIPTGNVGPAKAHSCILPPACVLCSAVGNYEVSTTLGKPLVSDNAPSVQPWDPGFIPAPDIQPCVSTANPCLVGVGLGGSLDCGPTAPPDPCGAMQLDTSQPSPADPYFGDNTCLNCGGGSVGCTTFCCCYC